MPSLAELANVSAASKGTSSATSVARAVAAGGGIPITITIQGQGVLLEHFLAMAQMTDPIVNQLVLYFGEATKEVAKQIHQPNIDTQATYDSISAGPDPGGPPAAFRVGTYGWGIDIGPFTPYSVFQEFGYTHHISGAWIQNPFMIPAADVIDPLFTDAMVQLAEVAADRRWFTGPAAASGAAGILGSFRNSLYAYSKFAGDLRIVGIGGLGGSRGAALRTAQGLGDLDAAMRGAISARVSRRVAGRFAGGGVTATVSTRLTGPSSSYTGGAGRIYNRIRGRVIGRGLRGI